MLYWFLLLSHLAMAVEAFSFTAMRAFRSGRCSCGVQVPLQPRSIASSFGRTHSYGSLQSIVAAARSQQSGQVSLNSS